MVQIFGHDALAIGNQDGIDEKLVRMFLKQSRLQGKLKKIIRTQIRLKKTMVFGFVGAQIGLEGVQVVAVVADDFKKGQRLRMGIEWGACQNGGSRGQVKPVGGLFEHIYFIKRLEKALQLLAMVGGVLHHQGFVGGIEHGLLIESFDFLAVDDGQDLFHHEYFHTITPLYSV